MTILVFGSLNMDFVAQVSRLPQVGETLRGNRFTMTPGGKGANQAAAVARLGGDCRIVGRVGGDPFGAALTQQLHETGVDCSAVSVDSTVSSGAAVIEVSDSGDNRIVVIPGANGQVGESDLMRLAALLPQASWLLLQLEIPLPVVVSAARAARAAGVRVMLDPAPAQALPSELYGYVDVLTPNQTEAERLTGRTVTTQAEATEAAAWLRQRGVSTVVITLGAQGAFYRSSGRALSKSLGESPEPSPGDWASDDTGLVPAFPVKVVDTVAAGDTFNGALAIALSQRRGASGRPEPSLYDAIRYGAAAAAIAVTRAGAQAAMPTALELEGFLSQHTSDSSLDRNL